MKQTGVEWLVEQMKLDGLFNADYFINQAKEIEKEQKGYTQEEVIEIISNFHKLKLNEFKNLLDLLQFKNK
jgi:hypothetical protein